MKKELCHTSSKHLEVVGPFAGSFAFLDRKVMQSNNAPFGGSFSWLNRNLCAEKAKKPKTIISLAINDICNLGCPHCIVKNFATQPENELVLNQRLRERLKEMGCPGTPPDFISFAGKEPTETPEKLVWLAEAVRQFPETKTILMTHAYKLTPELQHQLTGLIDYLDPSLDGIGNVIKPAFANGKETSAWQHIKYAVKNKQFKKVGIIVTLMPDTYKRLPELLNLFAKEFGNDDNVSATIWFYIGQADDPLLLNKKQFLEAISIADNHPWPNIQIALPGHYMSYLPDLVQQFNIDQVSQKFCSQTGIESYLIKDKILILPTNLNLLRIEFDGRAYAGCGHYLNLDEAPLGNIAQDTIAELFSRLPNSN
ncbi:MAG: radical SAM/SPASM domain-containing protein [Patescibacteria group bacterium]